MKMCFCNFILALAIVVVALFWWPAPWTKWVFVVAGAILALKGIFLQGKCCCKKE